MKRLRIVLVGLVLIGILLTIWWRRSPLYHEVRSVASFTTIDAPADRVLKTLTDFDKYPEWNPYIVKVESAGKNLATHPKIHIVEHAGKYNHSHSVKVTRFDQDGFAWQGSLFPGFLLSWREGFEVTPVDDSHSRLTVVQSYQGLLLRSYWNYYNPQTLAATREMGAALKRRTEGH